MKNENKNENRKTGNGAGGQMRMFAEKEAARIASERKERMDELGYLPFYVLDQGAHDLEFADEEPVDNKLYPERKVFHVIANGADMSLSISTRSPLYRDVIANLAEGKAKMQITRIGTGKTDTRYSVKA